MFLRRQVQLLWDYGYFGLGHVPDHNPRTDPRLGLFQNKKGKFDLPVTGKDIVSMERKELDPSQVRYVMESGYDEDFVIVPTLRSIKSGEIPFPFRVNHDSHNPTHKLIWVPDKHDYPHSHYVLEGRREIDKGTEITFDYNYKIAIVYKF